MGAGRAYQFSDCLAPSCRFEGLLLDPVVRRLGEAWGGTARAAQPSRFARGQRPRRRGTLAEPPASTVEGSYGPETSITYWFRVLKIVNDCARQASAKEKEIELIREEVKGARELRTKNLFRSRT
jgi:hypothetical protein